VIANALGAEEMDDEGADRPAFTEEECDAVRDWYAAAAICCLLPIMHRSAVPPKIWPIGLALR